MRMTKNNHDGDYEDDKNNHDADEDYYVDSSKHASRDVVWTDNCSLDVITVALVNNVEIIWMTKDDDKDNGDNYDK